MSLSVPFCKFVLRNGFDKSAKDRGLKIDTNVLIYKNLDGRPKFMRTSTFSGASVTDLDKLQRRPYAVDLSSGSGTDPSL